MRGDDSRQALVELLYGLRILGRIEARWAVISFCRLSSAFSRGTVRIQAIGFAFFLFSFSQYTPARSDGPE